MVLRSFRLIAAVGVSAVMAAALAACSHQQSTATATVATPAGFGLYYNDQGQNASLAYGQANSDNVALMLQCAKGQGRVQVSDVVRADPAPAIVLASGGQRSELLSRVEEGVAGAPQMVLAETTTDAGALKTFRRTGKLLVSYGDVRYQVAASREEQTNVELFFSVCGTSKDV